VLRSPIAFIAFSDCANLCCIIREVEILGCGGLTTLVAYNDGLATITGTFGSECREIRSS